ncbi:hypothetical protein PTKIN_Ptkin03bG0128600 [Pterospermum kingtungense]
MENRILIVFSFILLPILSTTISAQRTKLTPYFYRTTCPNVESIVRSAVQKKFQQTFVTAPATLRLFFHDCFVRGCDASVLLASANGNAEKDHPDDISLAGDGFDTVIKAKAAVDSVPQCRKKVSCADILALATREVIRLTGGPFYSVELGRRDGRISTKASVQNQLPHPNFNLDQLNSMFAKHGLSQTDMIALSVYFFSLLFHGNYILVRCTHLRILPLRAFLQPNLQLQSQEQDRPYFNFNYALQLRQMCPKNVDPRIAINMDPTTPRTFDNAYYKNLQKGMGLFTSDQILFTDRRSRKTLNLFASSNAAFQKAFVAAMTKLGRVRVLTGNQGEIRRDCTRPN